MAPLLLKRKWKHFEGALPTRSVVELLTNGAGSSYVDGWKAFARIRWKKVNRCVESSSISAGQKPNGSLGEPEKA